MQQGARIQDPVFVYHGDSNRPSALKPNWNFNLGVLACTGLIFALGAFLDWNIQQVGLAILAILGAGGIGYLSYQIVIKRLRFNPLISVVGMVLSIIVSLLTWIFSKGLNAAYLKAGKLPSKEPDKETENKP